MDNLKSVWRENGAWFAPANDGNVYELIAEEWDPGLLVRPAERVVSERLDFPRC